MDDDRKRFGEYFRELRIKSRQTLRRFCLDAGFDASSISKIERGLYPAPQADSRMREYAIALGLTEGRDEWVTLFDLWSRAKRYTTLESVSESELPHKLPVLFRTQDNKDLSEKKLDEVIKIVQSS